MTPDHQINEGGEGALVLFKEIGKRIQTRSLYNIFYSFSGDGAEDLLVQLLNKYQSSPFQNDRLDSFIRNRKKEIERLEFILEDVQFRHSGIKLVDYDDTMDMSVVFTKPYVLMLRFNVIPSEVLVKRFLEGEEIHEEK